MSRRTVLTVALVATVALFGGCTTGAGQSSAPFGSTAPGASPVSTEPGSPAAIELTVYAAASLRDSMAAARTAYEATVPGVIVTVATDASSTLRTQIEQGAPADVFLSADQTNPTKLVDGGLADGPAVDFARNELAIIVPLDNPAAIASPADLARPGIKVIAAGDEVPITTYADRAIANLAALAGYPTDFAAGYSANVVSREENVKVVVGKIELGEGDAAIVYATDAKASTKVGSVGIPPGANVTATYAGVVVKASAQLDAAHAFLEWLAGPDGVAILGDFGFEPPA